MQYSQLRKRLLLESAAIAGILAAAGAVAFGLGVASDNYQASSESLESQVDAIAASTSALSAKYDKVRENPALFKKVTQLQSENRLSISQQVVKNRFDYLRDKYYLADLHLVMSPIADVQGPDYQRKTNVIVSSDVSINFQGLSDEYAYGLLNALQQDLPGSSKITSLTLTRQGDVTKDMLRTISETGAAPLIKGEIKFVWFGIKPAATGDSDHAPKKP